MQATLKQLITSASILTGCIFAVGLPTTGAKATADANTVAETPTARAPNITTETNVSSSSQQWNQFCATSFTRKPIARAIDFDNSIAIFGDEEVKLYDESSNRLKALTLPTVSEIVWVGCDATNQVQYALGKRLLRNGKKRVFLVKRIENEWQDLSLPSTPDSVKGKHPQLVVGDGTVLFVTTERCSRLEGGDWKTIKLAKGCVIGDSNNSLVCTKDFLYSGIDLGDSGYVDKIDIKTGGYKRIFSTKAEGVTDLDLDREGKLWITCGFEKDEHKLGALYSYDTKKAHLKCASLISSNGKNEDETKTNWEFKPTAFQTTLVEKNGSILMLTRDLGLLRLSEGKWTVLTPDWHALTVSNMFQKTDGTVVICCPDRGLVTFNPATKKVDLVIPLEQTITE